MILKFRVGAVDTCLICAWCVFDNYYVFDVCMICVWCVWYVFDVCLICVWCVFDNYVFDVFCCVFDVWCESHVCLMCVWCVFDDCVFDDCVFDDCVFDVCLMTCIWCVFDLMCVWCVFGVCLLCVFDVCFWGLPGRTLAWLYEVRVWVPDSGGVGPFLFRVLCVKRLYLGMLIFTQKLGPNSCTPNFWYGILTCNFWKNLNHSHLCSLILCGLFSFHFVLILCALMLIMWPYYPPTKLLFRIFCSVSAAIEDGAHDTLLNPSSQCPAVVADLPRVRRVVNQFLLDNHADLLRNLTLFSGQCSRLV